VGRWGPFHTAGRGGTSVLIDHGNLVDLASGTRMPVASTTVALFANPILPSDGPTPPTDGSSPREPMKK
jgi:hypothetical protein